MLANSFSLLPPLIEKIVKFLDRSISKVIGISCSDDEKWTIGDFSITDVLNYQRNNHNWPSHILFYLFQPALLAIATTLQVM